MEAESNDESRAFWNEWNASTRESHLDDVSLDQQAVAVRWLDELGRRDLDILDVGCGTGWLCPVLTNYGRVTGTDLSNEVLERASQRWPHVEFIAGDFMALDFEERRYDVVVSFEVLSHVPDQRAFLEKVRRLLRDDGHLFIATQNKPTLERNAISPPAAGQLRRWVDRHELAGLLDAHFDVEEMRSITPRFNRGPLRVVNSRRVHRLLSNGGLSSASRKVKAFQEARWLGWTLMAHARARPHS